MAQGSSKRFWQNTAGIYGRTVRRSSGAAYDNICARIRERLTPEMTVLELACGTGQLTFPLCGSVSMWEATDLSEAMIARACKVPHTDRVRFSVQDACSLPYEHDTFDAVVMSNALHILPHPEKALRESRRVLRPGGLLFAPTYLHDGRRSLRLWLMGRAGFRVFHRWNAGSLIEFLQENGFAVEKAAVLPDAVAPLCYVEAVRSE